ncbi:diaminopimelate epimerase [Pseudooceanicola sediminis]|uniref:Diaminopimelate epimerase n=1 Tax=Pseudooceanicola sediminis TaxID=2211117 RepID=A0A399J4S4_9RHOB|nr:diaminopimelate epimerase [Pseudooceanicola sediminis]KAA2315711.1 diaminopimelate epimerase [Puniceibacterium sp. HSS470]RII40428.1 diaminopimelate epimerase [Pseudooceanicola sediminis]|tara:strand:+ start:132080 stop:132907 length:828 start_codon:yes stop_codon:yes gene_type:complete
MQINDFPHGLPFMKMHGLGNDFVVIDSRGREAVTTPALARAVGSRHFGVGFDQLAEIRDGDGSDITLDFWNSDGTRAQACGNATRCVAAHVLAEGGDSITIRTARGLLQARREGDQISVNMGPPQLDWHEVPLARAVDVKHLPLAGDPVAVGMGNPHCVFFVDDAEAVPLMQRGPEVEKDPLFPEQVNVEFAQVRSRDEIRMRVWERGTGVTLACGSGACATAVAAALRGLTERRVRMELDGGWLTLDWRDDGVWMTGPTAHVFDGVLPAAITGA